MKANIRSLALSALVSVVCGSCALPMVGGGVAGAGFDPVWITTGAKKYVEYRSPLVRITHEVVKSPNVKHTFPQMLDGFPEHTLVDQGGRKSLGDLSISFRRQHLLVMRDGEILIDERLPGAFYMHDLQVGKGRVGGREVLLFVNKSRATTGLCFVGLFFLSGERLWMTTIPSGEVWDCHYSTEGITFLNPSRQIRLMLGEPN